MSTPARSEAWRLATFNIQYAAADRWLRKREALVAELHQLEADVLCLQEVSAEGLAWLRSTMGNPPCFAAGREDGLSAGEHVPVMVLNPDWSPIADGTFWFSPSPHCPSVGWGAAHPRICTWVKLARPELPELTVFNVHLDHRSRRARLESGKLLQGFIESKVGGGLAVVCGDFNERRPERAMAPFPQRLYDVAVRAGANDPTWLGWSRLGLGRARIDYILADHRLELSNYELGGAAKIAGNLSDHRPAIADLIG